jgi:T5SS/PEP-CTERM-associated repeat protein
VLGSRPSEAQYTASYQTNIISGVASNWAGDYIVGSNYVFDALQIISGGVLSNGIGYLGYESAANNNSVVVRGSGSVWSNSYVYVGFYGSGNSVVISNGGTVVSSSALFIGDTGTSTNNSVVVSGSGSSWSNPSIFVGETGSGNSLVISNGGTVVNNYGYIGQGSGSSNNSVVVSGSGSVWNNSIGVFVGNQGSGNSLVISSNGTVADPIGYIGYNAGGNSNSVLVTGSGSVWSNTTELDVGHFGMGNSLVISNGGTVVSTNLFVGYYPSSSNNVVTLNGGNLTVTNPAQSGILDVRRGTLTLNSGTITADTLLLTNGVSSIVIFNGGTLTTRTATIGTGAVLQFALGTNSNPAAVSSNLTLGGTLNITDAGGFTNGTYYTLFSYGSTLTTNGTAGILTIGTTPDTNWVYVVDISSNHYVRLAAEPPPPVASFSGSPTNGVAPLLVTFTNTSSGWITNGFWNFGDNNTTNTTALSLNYTYTTGGTYTVSLTVGGPGGTNTSALTNYIVALTPSHLVVSPASRNYGIVTVGQTSNQTFSVINTGQQTLTGSVSSITSPFALVSGSPYTVTGGGTGIVTVSASGSSGIFTSSVIFVSNGGSSTNAVIVLMNAPPVVTAGTAQTVVLPTCALLNGRATDDGLPHGILTSTWSRVSGPGPVTFGNANVTNTTACFSTNGTYTLQLTASDGAASGSAIVTITTRIPPQITEPPSVTTNKLAQVGDLAVVAGGEPICFTVVAYSPDTNSLNYLWDFGDGATNDPCHVFTNCGPHEVSVVVSDPFASTNVTSTVAVGCLLDITKMQVKLNFARTNSDSCTLTATLEDLVAGYDLTNKVVTLDVGGAQVPFTLDKKGKGKGVNPSGNGSCKLAYNKRTHLWTLTANLKKGSWQTPWANYSMINSNIPKPGILITNFPVISVLDTNAFVGIRNLHYTAKYGKSGSAK